MVGLAWCHTWVVVGLARAGEQLPQVCLSESLSATPVSMAWRMEPRKAMAWGMRTVMLLVQEPTTWDRLEWWCRWHVWHRPMLLGATLWGSRVTMSQRRLGLAL